jgi:hypothetical protein
MTRDDVATLSSCETASFRKYLLYHDSRGERSHQELYSLERESADNDIDSKLDEYIHPFLSLSGYTTSQLNAALMRLHLFIEYMHPVSTRRFTTWS